MIVPFEHLDELREMVAAWRREADADEHETASGLRRAADDLEALVKVREA